MKKYKEISESKIEEIKCYENHLIRVCCHMGCKSKATHSIYYSERYEDYLDFCGKHLHKYLPNNYNVEISPIMLDGYNY
jgi:hypothetical protein